MGHASIEVTADIYLHSLDVHVRDTASMVESALGAPARVSDGAGRCPTCGQQLTSSGSQPVVEPSSGSTELRLRSQERASATVTARQDDHVEAITRHDNSAGC
jgi:hypothetical protein